MDTMIRAGEQTVATDTLGRRIVSRRFRSLEEKQRIVAESQQPGASVAQVARRHELNANLIFAWRRLQAQGLLARMRPRISKPAAKLLAVEVHAQSPAPTVARDGHLEIVLADDVRVRCIGAVDRSTLECVLGLLRR